MTTFLVTLVVSVCPTLYLFQAQPSSVFPRAVVPTEVKSPVGKQVVIRADTVGNVAWHWNKREIPEDQVYTDTSGKVIVITSPTAKSVSVLCLSVSRDGLPAIHECLVIFVGGPIPPPPDPPIPPVPDPLLTEIQKAYDADLGDVSKKIISKNKLGALFKAAAAVECRDPNIKTAKQLRDVLHAVAERTIDKDVTSLPSIVGTRKTCWSELLKVMPTETMVLDGKRDQIAAVFLQLSEVLQKVK